MFQNDPILGIAGFIDVETTGLSPYSEEIVEFAITLFEYHRQTGEVTRIVHEYVGLREPTIPIPPQATKVHGITMKDVKGKKLDKELIEALIHRAEFLISHNSSFDRGFTTRLFQVCSEKPWLCSMRGINWKARGFSSIALQNLLKEHRIQVEKAHRAQDDVKSAIELLSQTDRDGKTYLLELLAKIS